jgi:hypothetical protein
MASRLSITPEKRAHPPGSRSRTRHIMPAAGQAKAKVFVKRGTDEPRQVEAGEGEHGHGLVSPDFQVRASACWQASLRYPSSTAGLVKAEA